MTYCVGIKVNGGLALSSDSRTNAGVDKVATFGKMRVFERPGDRWIASVCSGHLGITQATLHRIEQEALTVGAHSWASAKSMWDVACLFGAALREELASQAFLEGSGVATASSFIVGGQIGAEAPRLFLIYPEGNFIEAQEGTSFFQIGETKYGKPILDRMIEPGIELAEAAKCLLVSFDSTMRSNLSVGYPIDLALYAAGSLGEAKVLRFAANDEHMQTVRREWGEGLRALFGNLTPPPGV